MDSEKEIQFKLASEIDVCDWAMLEALYKRGDLLLVDKQLNLLEVGVAMALDKADLVQSWQKESLILRPGAELVEKWSQDRYQKLGVFLILRPYVLVQLQEFESE